MTIDAFYDDGYAPYDDYDGGDDYDDDPYPDSGPASEPKFMSPGFTLGEVAFQIKHRSSAYVSYDPFWACDDDCDFYDDAPYDPLERWWPYDIEDGTSRETTKPGTKWILEHLRECKHDGAYVSRRNHGRKPRRDEVIRRARQRRELYELNLLQDEGRHETWLNQYETETKLSRFESQYRTEIEEENDTYWPLADDLDDLEGHYDHEIWTGNIEHRWYVDRLEARYVPMIEALRELDPDVDFGLDDEEVAAQ